MNLFHHKKLNLYARQYSSEQMKQKFRVINCLQTPVLESIETGLHLHNDITGLSVKAVIQMDTEDAQLFRNLYSLTS